MPVRVSDVTREARRPPGFGGIRAPGIPGRRTRFASAFIWVVLGAGLVVVAIDTRVLYLLAATTFLTRIRLLMGFVSLLVLVVTVEAIRRHQREVVAEVHRQLTEQ